VLYGDVDLRQVELAFNDSERIAAAFVQEGDRVHRGEILARLDTSRLGPEGAQAEATAAAQRAVVARLHHGSRPQEIGEAQAENHRLLGGDYHGHRLVFCQADGKPLHARNIVRRDFVPLAKKGGLPRCPFHDLRHAHVSYLALAGVPIKVAQERLGHSSSAVTLDVYSHVLPGMHEDAARRVETLLLGVEPSQRAVMSIDEQNGPRGVGLDPENP